MPIAQEIPRALGALCQKLPTKTKPFDFCYSTSLSFVLNKYYCQSRSFVLLTNLQQCARRHLLSGPGLRYIGVLEIIMCTVCIFYIKNDGKQDDFIDYFVTA